MISASSPNLSYTTIWFNFGFFSVANTAKRAFLIWLSVVMFGNQVTLLSAVGTITVIAGVFMYIKAQEYDDRLSSINLIQRKVRAI